MTTIGLVGNPNCGKTTLFNALTGALQRVGNWPGVTVERKSGVFKHDGKEIEVVDLPGTYSLVMASETSSVDERIACEYILNGNADVIVNILDASNLERNLYLTLQLLEMNVPMIIVLNMMDVARQRGMKILVDVLQEQLACSVIAIEAHKGKGISDLKKLIADNAWKKQSTPRCFAQPEVATIIQALENEIRASLPAEYASRSGWVAMRLLEDDVFAQRLVNENIKNIAEGYQRDVRRTLVEDADIMLADGRYRFIGAIITQCLTHASNASVSWTARIDKVVLNRFLGIPIFLVVMYCMFLFAINVGGAFQDFFDIGSNTIFVQGFAQLLAHFNFPNSLIALLANGVGRGINTTLTFIPVIGAMFLFLAFLEDSGYMARAAFIVDRVMRAIGLPGKSFVPMIVGFGCNVPSVMATRTLDNKRDRILTIMMSPFMSCGARLAIYAVFTAAFFPVGGQNIVFALYLIGIAMAMATGLMLRKTVLKGEPSPLVMELPPYHFPHVKTLALNAWQRLKGFVFRAGKLIVPICVIIGILSSLNMDGTINTGDGDANSLISYVGKLMTPIFAPMGIHQDNWPATVGLVTGVLAKEVVVGTLNAIYSQVGHITSLQAAGFDFWGGLHNAVMSIPQNLKLLGSSLGNPVLAEAPIQSLNQGVYGLMYERFDGQVGAFAYLLFVLLYLPCVSTTVAIVRELNRSWALFSALWTTGVAYCAAVFFYQAATVSQHVASSLEWMTGIMVVLGFTIFSIKHFAMPVKKQTLLSSGKVI